MKWFGFVCALLLSFGLVLALLLGRDTDAPTALPLEKSSPIQVVCTFTILADMVKNIGKEHVDVTFLVGPDADPHVFAPTPQSAESLAKADLVFINGLGFEGWMTRLVEASGYKGAVIVATEGIGKLLTLFDEDTQDVITDPHTWLTIPQALIYIRNITQALSAHAPSLQDTFEKNYALYKTKLEKLETDIQTKIQSVPRHKRRVITAHDAFGYFGKAYDIQFSAPQGITTESEASARDVAYLIDKIKREKTKAVFVENITNERLIRQIAQETGVRIQGVLYTDALSEAKGPASTYLKLLQHNANQLVAAMKKNQ